MVRELVINDFDGWCSAMGDLCPVICCHALAVLKEQESIIKSLKADLHETLEVVTNRKNIVRCKNCGNQKDCELARQMCDPDWFCADGEMRTDE